MKRIRILPLLLLLIAVSPSYAQKKDSCFLKWKLKPKEVLSYEILNHRIDTPSNHPPSFANLPFFNSGDTSTKLNMAATKMDDFIKTMSKVDENMVAHLHANKQRKVDVEIMLDDKTDNQTDSALNKMTKSDSLPNISSLFKQFKGITMTRGVISDDGQIESFYVTAGQRNLVALYFELPGHYVKVGDTWPLDVHFVSIAGDFKCDSSYRNNSVTVTDIQRVNGDCLVYLSYNISEYAAGSLAAFTEKSMIPTLMKIEYKGTACFSVNKGRWIKFQGIMFNQSEGMFSSQSTERYSLVEKL